MIEFSDNPASPWLADFQRDTAARFIANVETDFRTLRVGDHELPVTINDTQFDSSYVCSPYTACVSYAREELHKLGKPWLEFALGGLLSGVSGILKRGQINRVVSVNNWLLSTNLYPDWDGAEIPDITKMLTRRFPDRVVMFRSLNEHTNGRLLERFRESGYLLAPSRQVYIFDRSLSNFRVKQNTRWDLKLLGNTAYEIARHDQIQRSDYRRILELYNWLYLDKYSYHNPQFTESFIELGHRQQLLEMTGLRNPETGQLDGIIGSFERDGVTTVPLVGHDTALPRELGLYRMLMALAIDRADRLGLILNLSSGASHFKRLRGGVPFIEFSAVFHRHLPASRRAYWNGLNFLLTTIGAPLLRRFRL